MKRQRDRLLPRRTGGLSRPRPVDRLLKRAAAKQSLRSVVHSSLRRTCSRPPAIGQDGQCGSAVAGLWLC